MATCEVCQEEVSKYRCPCCIIRYCSVNCYKSHKDVCNPKKSSVSHSECPDIATPCQKLKTYKDKETAWSVKDLLKDESDVVPQQNLKLLGQSTGLKDLLHNPHLRQLLRTVDEAENKEVVMKAVMQEPLFVEFADCCLKIVEPAEKENAVPGD
ncbi:zinc finger HIT domain-containing protein 3 [Erpetoichthys calabaricus]|uniref:Zinc finger HIT domain-containing protein 3 n=1 Tax=Erpetoichthys calabaricus TaxID=27687 RepID=A0A8C4SU56_ERPCA|nr:zinc finger HIT domain-containing protein 3 [Erpetoichthys calabaricus]